MSSMNDLIKELRVNEIVNALITAFRTGNRDYISSTVELLHEEFMYTVSEIETMELTGETLKRASTLYALYCLGLGLLRIVNNESLTTDHIELLRNAINNEDLSSLTQSLIMASALFIRGDNSWIEKFNELAQGISNELIKSIIYSFLGIIRSINITYS
ncbi:MAG: hypothetical protein ACP5GZ_08260 [Vulcanisaeta sp.]|uniref:hypothetical protein n=1 Tax=Vulcanisaeta sp. TaxID=2020871 RepID=UPI003D0B828C